MNWRSQKNVLYATTYYWEYLFTLVFCMKGRKDVISTTARIPSRPKTLESTFHVAHPYYICWQIVAAESMDW